ncbi:CYTH and CHAD domain-containing protein [uncultured Nitratireductor sp.]|uniref:CYTH and CHAD domain-containing protein n=1 Tax=uncultured Nitratireductor sp. TaxID=520953 RepID=UPI0025FDE81E|nr:CYTH and CHAD domain-containing protein [uncultured Nitratireductor sp.]
MSEVELKLLLEKQQIPAVIARIEQLPQAMRKVHAGRLLRSIYFDTPARILRKNGISIRLRRDGKRWLQTVKLNGSIAGGLSKVTEIEQPALNGGISIDAIKNGAVRGEIEKLVSATPLQTVAETHIHRTRVDLCLEGGAKAELAVDSGAIKAAGRSEPLNELEIELVEGHPADLYKTARLLLPDGAVRFSRFSKAARGFLLAQRGHIEPPAKPRKAKSVPLNRKDAPSDAARGILRECLAQIAENIEAVRRCDDIEGPHQLRIGLRRLRVALALFTCEFDPASAEKFKKEARWLGREVGRLRDLDVVLHDIAQPFFSEGDRSHGAAPVLGTLQRHTDDVRADLRHLLSGERVNNFLLDLSELAETGIREGSSTKSRSAAGRKLKDLARAKLEKRWNHVITSAKGIDAFTLERKHRLRKELKKLRYTIEFFAPLYTPRSVKRMTEKLKTLQTVFGSLNDAAVADQILSKPPLSSINDLAAQRAIGRLVGSCETRAIHDWPAAKIDWKAVKTCPPFWKQVRK